MAFRFRSSPIVNSNDNNNLNDNRKSPTISNSINGKQPNQDEIENNVNKSNIEIKHQQTVLPKLTNSQLNKLTKVFPKWLKDNNNLKQLPVVYQGVLGQVQQQPNFVYGDNGQIITADLNLRLSNQQQPQLDYMNRFTDTERVRQLLSTSQLSDESLAAIWAHVNKTFPGKLTNREVCLALGLIALFQQKYCDHINFDPFNQIKLEKKPPVPKLYSSSKSHNIGCNNNANNSLLIDLQFDSNDRKDNYQFDSSDLMNLNSPIKGKFDNSSLNNDNSFDNIGKLRHLISLIDSDGDRFEECFTKLSQIWLKFFHTIRSLLKRSFDILNVENSRQSAIEALKSSKGKLFSKQLCLCYPIAHNIKFKIDEINKLKLYEPANSNKFLILDEDRKDKHEITIENNYSKNIYNINHSDDEKNEMNGKRFTLFDKNYIRKINDLMTSINEYWAVLINLFHESGQTKFIEFIMDGLNYKTKTIQSKTFEELANELNMFEGKLDVCSICLTKFYLVNNDNINNNVNLDDDEIELLKDSEILITNDNSHYYHARCANFWLNNVIPATNLELTINGDYNLPFERLQDEILSPNLI